MTITSGRSFATRTETVSLALQPSVITGSRDTGRDVEVREQDPRHAQARMAQSKSVTGLARLRGDWSHGAYHMTQVRKTDKELRARDRRPARVRTGPRETTAVGEEP